MSPMPRVFNPSPPDAGPGSAFAGTSMAKKRSRRRRKVCSHSPELSRTGNETDKAQAENSTSTSTQQQFIGQDLLDWHDEPKSTSGNLVSASKPGGEKPVAGNCDATTTTSITTDDYHSWTSRRALGVDTRFLGTTQGKIVAESVLKEYAAFIQTTVVRGVSPCWLASTVQGQSKSVPGKNKKSTSIRLQLTPLGTEKARAAAAGRAYFSLSKVELQTSANENETAVHIPKELLATNSWKVLGKIGTCVEVELVG
jgi:hypothetical protein